MDKQRTDDKMSFQERWQASLLPVMRAALVVIAIFFFAASLWQYHQLYQDLRQDAPTATRALIAATASGNAAAADAARFDALRWRTMVALEQDVMQMRYRQINAVLLLRTWTRQTGFLVGMVLSLVGAFFILGRIREEGTRLRGEGAGMKLSLASSSPGIVLAVLGTLLMTATLLVKFDYEVSDKPVYLPPYGLVPAGGRAGALPPPADMPASGSPDEGFPQPPADPGETGRQP